MDRKLKVYISGPIANQYYYDVIRQFQAAEYELISRGYDVLNPLNIDLPDHDNPDWYLCGLRWTLKMLLEADGICLLPGWETSNGAKIEKNLAESLKIEEISLINF